MNTIKIYAKCNDLFSLDLLKNGKKIDTYDGYPLDIEFLRQNSEVEFEVDIKTGKIINWNFEKVKEILEDQFGELEPKKDTTPLSNKVAEHSITIKVKKILWRTCSVPLYISEGIYYSSEPIDTYTLKEKIEYFFDQYDEIYNEDFDEDFCGRLYNKITWTDSGLTIVLDKDTPARIGKKILKSIMTEMESTEFNLLYNTYLSELDKDSKEQEKKRRQESIDYEENLKKIKNELMKYKDQIGDNAKFGDQNTQYPGFHCIVKIHSFSDPNRYMYEIFEKCVDLISNGYEFKLKRLMRDGRQFVEIYVSDENSDKGKELINSKYGKLIFF